MYSEITYSMCSLVVRVLDSPAVDPRSIPARACSPVIERLMVRGSQVALKHVIHDMKARTLVMELRRRAIKRWVPCGDMDRRLKIPHSAKAECGFRTTHEECLYDSGPIGRSV